MTTILGAPVVGEKLTCLPSGFEGDGITRTYAWLRDGATIAEATTDEYTPVAADVGRELSCVVTATNAAGDADSTSDAVTVSAASAGTPGPAGPPGSQGPPGPPGPQGERGPAGEVPTIRVRCRLVSRRRISCRVSSRPAEDARASIRPAGSKARASRRGRGTIRLAVTTRRKLALRPRVVVRYRSATANVRAVVPTGRTAKLAAGGR